MGMPGGYGFYEQGMQAPFGGVDPYGYGAGYGGGMMGYGGMTPYAGGITYPTIDYSGLSGRAAGEILLMN